MIPSKNAPAIPQRGHLASPGLWGMKQIAHGVHKKSFVLMLPGFLDTVSVSLRGLGSRLRLPAPSPRENIEKANILLHQKFDRYT